MCSATCSVLLFSHAEDLDPEEGEGDVDSQLSGQQGGETFQPPFDLTLTLAIS